jgi:hypothetical protein
MFLFAEIRLNLPPYCLQDNLVLEVYVEQEALDKL